MMNLQEGLGFKIELQRIVNKYAIVAFMLVLSGAAMQARADSQSRIDQVKVWNCGSTDYIPELQADGSILFTGYTEGQPLAFRFAPSRDKTDEYMIVEEDQNEYENPFWASCRAIHKRKDGQNLLCLYDEQGRLRDVLSPLEYTSGQEQVAHKWARQLMGEYTSMYDEPLVIEDNGKMRFSSIDLTYQPINLDGMIKGVVEIQGGTRLEGFFEVEITRDGLIFTPGIMDDDWEFQATDVPEVFSWSRKDVPRFDYASKILLNDEWNWRHDNSLWRLIRNEIWFHHGYVPTSPDLQEYLEDKEWYSPRASNDGIFEELSLIEALNIERIKTIEAITAQFQKSMAEVDKQVNNVYDYLESIRRYYLDTPEDQIEDRVWQTADELFGSRAWRELRAKADAAARDCECGSYLEFGDAGPFDAWTYDCFEGKVTPKINHIFLSNDGSTAYADLEIKDATSITAVPLSWRLIQENGEWRVDNIIFLKDGNINLMETMLDFIIQNTETK